MKGHWMVVIFVSVMILGTLSFSAINAQSEYSIPSWVKGVANFWVEDNISDYEFGEAITFLIEQGILRVELPDVVNTSEDDEWKSEAGKLFKENQQLTQEIKSLKEANQLLRENSDLNYELYLEQWNLNQGYITEDQITEYGDARLASINPSYDKDTDRLTVSIFLTDSNAEDTKADGNAELTILREDGREVYSATYNFVKDDFVSWKNMFGDKRTAYVITINKFFPSGESRIMEYHVYVNLNTETRHWEDLFEKFWSINESS